MMMRLYRLHKMIYHSPSLIAIKYYHQTHKRIAKPPHTHTHGTDNNTNYKHLTPYAMRVNRESMNFLLFTENIQ